MKVFEFINYDPFQPEVTDSDFSSDDSDFGSSDDEDLDEQEGGEEGGENPETKREWVKIVAGPTQNTKEDAAKKEDPDMTKREGKEGGKELFWVYVTASELRN